MVEPPTGVRGLIAYASFDGVMSGLGYAQIARVLAGLGARGFRYHLVSLEKPDQLANAGARERTAARLEDAGVGWTPLPYARGGGAAMARNLARVGAALARLRLHGLTLVHARGYQSALAAAGLKMAGVPFLFDTRGYWIDERLDEERLFTRPVVLRGARVIESHLYRRAAAVVTLTRLQAEDLRAGRFGRCNGRVETIPTCADFEAFRPRTAAEVPPLPALGGCCVIGIVGGLNVSYLTKPTLALARRVLAARPEARLLVISEQQEEWRRIAAEAGVDLRRCTLASVSHDEMPRWVRWIDWGLQLLATRPSKRASMPTKLSEFLASGTRPVHTGCNEEVAAWVRETGSGIVLEDVSEDALDRAAACIAGMPRDEAVLQRARDLAAPHFSLTRSLDRYATLLESLGQRGGPAHPVEA